MRIKLTGTNLVVNGETVDDGDCCDVGDAEAKALIERGLAKEDDGTVAAGSSERHDQIVSVIRDLMKMDPRREDPESWTKAGKPEVKALESLLDFDITAAERDAALAEVTGE